MRILVVDDEEHALKELVGCLKKIRPEAETVPFVRSDEAFDYAKTDATFEVAFLDVSMPVINGIDFAKELKKLNPKVNIVFCTAYSDYALDAIRMRASGYVTKPYEKEDIEKELNNLLHPVEAKMPKFFARAFGDFDFFVDGVAIGFPRAKSKELLAYLIYKRGGTANAQEIASVLFGDEYNLKAKNYLVHIWSDLVKTLKQCGAEDILVKGYNQYSVNTNAFSCDLYDYDKGLPEAINAYDGDIMAQYDWARL